MDELAKLIGDQKLLRLMRKVLKAGYVEFPDPKKVYSPNLPQGNPLSPLLANVVLHRFDLFLRKVIAEDTLGSGRCPMNRSYRKFKWARLMPDRRRSVRLCQETRTPFGLLKQEDPSPTQLVTCRERLGNHLQHSDRIRNKMNPRPVVPLIHSTTAVCATCATPTTCDLCIGQPRVHDRSTSSSRPLSEKGIGPHIELRKHQDYQR